MKSDWLQKYNKIVTSQCGEDGILEKISQTINSPVADRWVVEFGASDGKQFSNSWSLINNNSWSAVLIEADNLRYRQLKKRYDQHPQVTCLNRMVNFSGKYTLDKILQTTPIPKNFNLLSIDIDGNDYHIWQTIENYTPKVVIIEFNPSIPVDIEYIQPKDLSINQGSSLLSITKLARQKGYELIATTKWNAIFTRKKYFKLFRIKDNSPVAIYRIRQYQTQIFQLLDGTIKIVGNTSMLWHGVQMDANKMQVIPRLLRQYPQTMNLVKKIVYLFWTIFIKNIYHLSYPQIIYRSFRNLFIDKITHPRQNS